MSHITYEVQYEIDKEEKRKELGTSLFEDHYHDEEDNNFDLRWSIGLDPEFHYEPGYTVPEDREYRYDMACLYDPHLIKMEIWNSLSVYESILKFHQNEWHRSYFRFPLSAITRIVNNWIDKESFPVYNANIIRSHVQRITKWACYSYCWDQDCWINAMARHQSNVVVDITKIDLNKEKEEEHLALLRECPEKPKRKLTKEGAKSRSLTREINRMIKSGQIRNDLDQLINNKLDRPKGTY